MNTLAKLIASIAALVASFAVAWIAKDGVNVHHTGNFGLALSGNGAFEPNRNFALRLNCSAKVMYVYEVRPRKDKRGVDLTSDILPFGRLWYGEPNAVICGRILA